MSHEDDIIMDSTSAGSYTTTGIDFDHDQNDDASAFQYQIQDSDEGLQFTFNDHLSNSPSLDSSIEMDHTSWGNIGLNDISMLGYSEEEEESQIEKDLRQLSSAFDESQYEVTDLEKRVQSRTKIIETLRTAYLKDVVTLKHILDDVLTKEERRLVISEYNSRLPSVDLRKPLKLFGPKGAELRVKPCQTCGGVVDVTLHDSEATARMTKAIHKYRSREDKLKLQIATCDARYERESEAHRLTRKSHDEEKRFLYAEMKKINIIMDKLTGDNYHHTDQIKNQREKISNLNECIKQLEFKEKRLGLVEAEIRDHLVTIGQLTQNLFQNQQDASIYKAKLYTLENKIIPALNEKLSVKDMEITKAQSDLGESLVSTAKFREMCLFLEKNGVENTAKIASLETRIQDVEMEMLTAEDSTKVDLLRLEEANERLMDNLKYTQSELREKESKLAATSALLIGCNEELMKKNVIIKQREDELMDSAAEMEAIEEELAAMKQFLSDTVATRKTPSRSRRTREHIERGGGEGELEESETMGIEHPEMKFDWANVDTKDLSLMSSTVPGVVEESRKVIDDENFDMHIPTPSIYVSPTSQFDDIITTMPVEIPYFKTIPDVKLKKETGIGEAGKTDTGITGRQMAIQKEVIILPVEQDFNTSTDTIPFTSASTIPTPIPSQTATTVIIPGIQSFSNLSTHSSPVSATLVASAYELGTRAPIATNTVTAKKSQKPDIQRLAMEIDVDLLPATDNAPPGELMLRESLFKTLSKSIGTGQSKRAMNAMRELLSVYGHMLTNATRALWNAILLSKRGLDFMTKIKIIGDGILTCNREGIDETGIGKVMMEIVPIAGATLGSKLASSWVTACDIPTELANHLIPSLDTRGELEVVVYKDYAAYFSTNQNDTQFTILESNSAINSLTDHADHLAAELASSLVTILRTWYDNKIIATNLPDIISDAKDQTRQEMSLHIEALQRDVILSIGKVDSQKQFIKSLESKIENLTKRVMDLSPYTELHATALADIERLLKQKSELESTIIRLESEYWCSAQLNDEYALEILMLKGTITNYEKAIVDEAAKSVSLEQSLLKEQSEKTAVTMQLSQFTTAALEKTMSSVTLQTQTENRSTESASQTDFLSIPFSLRSVVAKGKGKYERDRPFSVTIAKPEIDGGPNDAIFSPNFIGMNRSLRRFGSTHGTRTVNAKGEIEISLTPIDKHMRSIYRSNNSRGSSRGSRGGSVSPDDFGVDVTDDISEYTTRNSPTSPLASPSHSRITTIKHLIPGGPDDQKNNPDSSSGNSGLTHINLLSSRLLEHDWTTPTPKSTPKSTPTSHTVPHSPLEATHPLAPAVALTIQTQRGQEFLTGSGMSSGMGMGVGVWDRFEMDDSNNLETDSIYSAELSIMSSVHSGAEYKYNPNKSRSSVSEVYNMLNRGKDLVPRKAIPQVLHSTLGLVSVKHAKREVVLPAALKPVAHIEYACNVPTAGEGGTGRGMGRSGNRGVQKHKIDTDKLSLLQGVHYPTGSKR